MCRLLWFVAVFSLRAETGYQAWLRYEPLSSPPDLPAVVRINLDDPVMRSAQSELIRGLRGMLGRTLRAESGTGREPAILLECCDASHRADDYTLRATGGNISIRAGSSRGVLYGAFGLLRKVALGESLANLNEKQRAQSPIRWVNEWNNLDGTIERGYGGRSIFWESNQASEDLTRVADYARLLASVGIQACSINNVNANPRVLTAEFAPQIARIADAMRPWGIRAAIAIDFGSPKSIGGLDTFDPLDDRVAAFWKARVDDLYKAVPDLAGFVLKADSEGRVGPAAYGRTHADAANVIARALAPHGGILFYRGFVYDHKMDWNNPKNDRARAASDNFVPLDGKFDANVIVQVKNGPIDFQVREPASPLFGALEKTKQAIELQITQEYFGQARHTVFLVPYWKDTLDFDLRVNGRAPVKSRVAAFVGVSNVGLDENWTGNHLSQANLYGFGRLAWNADLSSEQISDEWTRLTFGNDPKVLKTVNDIQLSSWRTYENYTGPLGLQTLTDIVGNHYSVNVEASERNGWGQWHRADNKGVGMDRTVATGTGYIGQYRPEVARVFESVKTCPDDLLLFLHHVPYTHKLRSGSTVAQFIYDSHYEGAARVAEYARQWKGLQPLVDERRYSEVLAQLEYQAGQAVVWRDAVAGYFQKRSGIPDSKGRVGKHPERLEAESMQLDGYAAQDIVPWEAASGSK
jgi:alpha-glucuronidase